MENASSSPDSIAAKLDLVEELSWKLMDQDISGPDLLVLEQMLLENEGFRGRYVQCLQLHCDLEAFFRTPTAEQILDSVKTMPRLNLDGIQNSGVGSTR